MKRRWAGLAVASLVALGACGGRPQAMAPAGQSPAFPQMSSPGLQLAPEPTPSAGLASGSVFVVVLENTGYGRALAQPFTAALAARYALATNYFAVAHPSLPNYLALTSGSTWGVTDDGYHRLPAQDLGTELSARGVSWRAYMEGMTAGCFDSPPPYALKHNPFAYYGGACPPNVVPLSELESDLAGTTPRFVWVTPDLCHDGHDCGPATADRFLSELVPKITASPAWSRGGVLFVTWDEDDGAHDNHVACLVVAPRLAAHTTAVRHDHYSLLATVEDLLGVPRLGASARAQALTELLGG